MSQILKKILTPSISCDENGGGNMKNDNIHVICIMTHSL
jgi:hypothetical protein